jgi:predicted RNA-binding protein with RPS1 domain
VPRPHAPHVAGAGRQGPRHPRRRPAGAGTPRLLDRLRASRAAAAHPPAPAAAPSLPARSLQSARAARPAARPLRAAATAAAEPEVAAEPAAAAAAAPAAADAPPAPAGERKDRRKRSGGGRPTIGAARTMDVSALEVGASYPGTVVAIAEFGAFVNVGAQADGLLHISQISTGFVRDVAESLAVGQELEVRVIGVDAEKGKFSVSAIPAGAAEAAKAERAAAGGQRGGGERGGGGGGGEWGGAPGERPRAARAAPRRERKASSVAKGDVLSGAVTAVRPFGVFIDLGDGTTGMLHASQWKLPEGKTSPNEGEVLEVRVASVSRDRVSLTQKSEEEIALDERTSTYGLAATGAFLFVVSIFIRLFSAQLICPAIPLCADSRRSALHCRPQRSTCPRAPQASASSSRAPACAPTCS